jgi:hypothetical protein
MPDILIQQSDIENLGRKLSSLDTTLSDKERALLAGILAVARDAIHRSTADNPASPLVTRVDYLEGSASVAVEGSLPEIRNQIIAAFMPGAIPDVDVPAVMTTIPGGTDPQLKSR